MRKLLVLALVLFALPVVSAMNSTNMILAMDCDGNNSDSLGLLNANNGTNTYTTGKIGQSCDYNGATQMEFNDSTRMSFNGSAFDQPFTMSAWVKIATASSGTVFSKANNAVQAEYWLSLASGKPSIRLWTSTGNLCDYQANASLANTTLILGSWNHIVWTYNGSKDIKGVRIWLNNVSLGMDVESCSGAFTGLPDTTEKPLMGAWRSTGAYGQRLTGQIDQLYIWRGAYFNATEISQLYRFNTSCAYPFTNCTDGPPGPGPPAANKDINVTAMGVFANTSILDINVTISNMTFSVYNLSNASTGVASFHNASLNGTYNLTVQNAQFFNRTFEVQFNATAHTYNATLYQSALTVEAFDTASSAQVLAFNATFLPYQRLETTNGSMTFYTLSGAYNVSVDAVGRFNNQTNVTLANLTTTYVALRSPSTQLNVTVLFFGSTVSNFTTRIIRQNTDYAQDQTNNTVSGVSTFYVTNGTYNISVDPPGYTLNSTTFTITGQTIQVNLTVYENTVLNVTFRDAISRNIITYANISIDFISDAQSASYYTDNGTLYVALLAPATYTLRYSAPGYPLQFNQFTINNRTFDTLTLYLMNATNAQNITVSVIDENTLPVEGATVTTLRYDITTNTYLEQESAITNFQGQTQFSMQMNLEYYKFLISYNGELLLTTEPDQIHDTSLTFQIVIGETATQSFQEYLDVSYNLSFNNVTRNFAFTYSDLTNTLSGACLYVYIVDLIGRTLINSSCPSSSAATIVLGAPVSNGSMYLAEAFVLFPGDTEYTFVASMLHYDQIADSFEYNYVFILYLFFVLFALMARFSLLFPLLLGPLPIVAFSLLGWIPLQPWAAFTIFAVCLSIAVIVIKRM